LSTARNSFGNSATTFLRDGTATSSIQWGSPMERDSPMAMADGSVRQFPYGITLTNFLLPTDGIAVNVP
ncbi:MAG: hypothetical protein RMJ56_06210, partial [Gemmataceae bacterium]|nr:hypothetical protein [Gemmataceae bacterium]